MTKYEIRVLFSLLFLITLGQLGVDLYVPSMPSIAREFNSPVSLIKSTVPSYLLGFGISQLIYGPLSDRFGRNPTLYISLGIFLIGSLICSFAQTAYVLVSFRVLQGLGAGGAIVTLRAIMRDVFHGKLMAKVSAAISMAWAMTPMIAPVIGGYIQMHLGWRFSFFAMCAYVVFVLLFIFFFLKEPLPKEQRNQHPVRYIAKVYLEIFTNRLFLTFSVMSSLCYAYFISFATISPFLLQDQLKLSPVQYGWAILFIALGYALGSILCTRLVHHFKIVNVILAGWIIMFCATFMMWLIAFMGIFNLFSFVLPPFLGTMGAGMIFPNCMTGALTPHKKNAGMAGGSFGCIQMLNGFLFSLTISHIDSSTPTPLSAELLLISLIIGLLFFFFIRPHFEEESEVKPQI